MDLNAKELKKRADRLFAAKAPLDSLNQEIASNFYAARADFTSELELGEEFGSHLLDTYPEMVRRDLALAVGSMLRPSDRQWFRPFVDDDEVIEDAASNAWLDYAQKVMARIIGDPAARFRRATTEGDNDFATFGYAVISNTFNRAKNGLVLKTWHPRDVAFAEDNEGGIGVVYRKSSGPVCHAAQQFGTKRLPASWREKLDKDEMAKVTVYHVAMKNDDYDAYGKIRAPWASIYFSDCEDILAEAGDIINQYVIPRWQTIGGRAYPFSPATIIALPQARLIQRMMLTIIEAAEKAVDPPLVATHEVIKSEVDLSAGGVTWVDRQYDERLGESLRPLMTAKDVPLGIDLLERQRMLLQEAFYLNKIRMPAQTSAKTAYETAQLVEEYVRNALPLFEPLEDEYNSALLDSVASRAFQAGAFGPKDTIPAALQGRDIAFRFTNPLRESIEKRNIVAFQETSQLLAVAAQLDQGSMAEVDVKTMLRDAVKSTGAPSKWLLPKEQAEAARQQAMQAQAAQQGIAQAGQVAEVAKTGAAAGVDMATIAATAEAA